MLGDIVQKYESGSLGARSISTGIKDPGGVSYGKYQLASKTGTLTRFLTQMGYAKDFIGLTPGTKEFNTKWLEMVEYPNFVHAQWLFIKKTHYDPLRIWADKCKIPHHPAIDESLWSMSIQHGKAALIVSNSLKYMDKSDTISIVKALYQARCEYVDKLNMSNLKKRYASELKDVLTLCQS